MPASPEEQAADLALMRAVADGSPEAVARLYDRFNALVFQMAYHSLPTREDATDAVQEIFVRLWRTASRYDPERAALVTWVMLISRRYIVDRLRRLRVSTRVSSLDEKLTVSEPVARRIRGSGPPVEGEGQMDTAERFTDLRRRIDQLPDLQRTVVTRAYLQGRTLREIHEELQTPLGTIKSALSRALVRLREDPRAGEGRVA
ncbi:MAG: sigma-70 family RNA polymerase sigma factor [Planctomycetaceae bacterium]|jgi:RNA polymerase sigma-70 factor (ECF subfamily)|nr:sigma-70 family RNA polymerase sigma factor [Planctomycetaceae bacterium]